MDYFTLTYKNCVSQFLFLPATLRDRKLLWRKPSKNIKRFLVRYKHNTTGSFALLWALSLFAVLMTVGAAYDYSRVSAVSDKTQDIADSIALQAAVYVKDFNKTPPSDADGFVHGKTYKLNATPYTFNNLSKSEAGSSTFKVLYDAVNLTVTVQISGKTQSAIMQIFGKKELKYSVDSVVKYDSAADKVPVSLFLVLDSSYSMYLDDKPLAYYGAMSPAGAVARIDGLKKSVKNLMNILNDAALKLDREIGARTLRTGMTVYNHELLDGLIVQPSWGDVKKSRIDIITPSGGTNSSKALSTARDWMLLEDNQHKISHGETPKKYVILISDGVNNAEQVWVPESGTDHWRIWGNWQAHYFFYKSEIHTSYPGEGWEEGRYETRNLANEESQEHCDAMKLAGIEVFTIGFALEPGVYGPYVKTSIGPQPTGQTEETSKKAYAFLRGCASKPDNFIKAEDSEKLNKALMRIGTVIENDALRIGS